MPKKKKPIRYPWTRWFRKKKFELVKGRDFHRIEPYVMSQQIRSYAFRRGFSVSVKIHGSKRLEVTVIGDRE